MNDIQAMMPMESMTLCVKRKLISGGRDVTLRERLVKNYLECGNMDHYWQGGKLYG